MLAIALFFSIFLQKPDEPRRLTTDGSFKQHLQWSPDGQQLLMTRIHEGKMSLWLIGLDGKNYRRLLPSREQPHFDGCWSPDGKRIIYVADRFEGTDGKLFINTCHPDGSDETTVIPHVAFEESPRWSKTGQQILWVSTRDDNPELYILDTMSKKVQRLTSEVAFDWQPSWSPDNRRIAFASSRTGRQKIYVMKADGSEIKRITDGDWLDAWPTWQPQGQHIAIQSNRTKNYDIWLMTDNGQSLRNLTDHPAQDMSPTWSPDGKKLAFVSNRDGGWDIYIMSLTAK